MLYGARCAVAIDVVVRTRDMKELCDLTACSDLVLLLVWPLGQL